jgi:preprotein translocase subunit SecD
MANLRLLLLVALLLGTASNLFACKVSNSSATLSSTPLATASLPDIKVRHSRVQLAFREQKLGTEVQLQIERQVQRELLKKQTDLKKSGNQTAIATNAAALKRSDEAISLLFERPTLTEKNLTEADFDSRSSSAFIMVKFDAKGTKAFTALTKKLAGTGRTVGIFLNNRLISSPMISSEYAQTGITGGTAMITGNFSAEEAKDLAAQLRGDPKVSPRQL